MSTGKFAVEIGGAAVTVPGVYTVADKSAMVAPRGTPARALAIVASARGGTVGGITRVLAGDEARLLRGGVGAQMARAAFEHGMKEVLFVRVDQATPATLDLGAGVLYAVNPGRASSALQGKTAPNVARPDALDLFLKDASGGEQDEVYRMIGPLLDLSYVGRGSNPAGQLDLDPEDGSVTLSLRADGDPGATLSVNSNAVPTVAEAVEAINRSASWTARAVGQPATPLNVADAGPLAFGGARAEMGAMLAAAPVAATIYGSARLLALILEQQPSRMARLTEPVQALLVSDPGASAAAGPVGLRITGAYEFFQGGEDGPVPSANDYIDALRLLERVPVTAIALGTGDPVAVAALASHVGALSGVKARRERFGGAGAPPQNSKSEFIRVSSELATMFSDVDRLVVAGNTPYHADVQTGRLIEQHGAVLVAAALAIKVGGRPEEPLTFKRVRFPKLKYSYSTEELEDLIEAGVMPVHFDQEQGANLIMAGITTYTADANVASRKLAAVDAIDYLNKKVRQRVTSLSIGKVADEARVKTVLQSVAGLLNEEIRNTRNPVGILTPGIDLQTNQPVAAWRNLTAVFDGFDLVGVDFDCNIIGEIAYVRVRPRFTPVRIEARQ
ncbi:hypothetical protein Dgeo_3040 (plasmid) [Deinococcus geothermalis DSM 11300]|uniref:Tail sheath protein subtilisin-like domain-containing protein n=1 Tax=Deinococcus geothermalis (strain DSM 11300 / CIP 105573 / AG-3a) TaxID=319795 RepID=A8ZRH2_DEIGD|nr:hypothetical protein [Deinococcus geothermalis]ABW35081.1 hypothetical protein Dgeo_3040 [Deinococcus geothermalis DSM 11300]